MERADQTGIVGVIADRDKVDLEVLGLQDDLGARDRKLTQPAVAKAAADHDPLGLGPGLGLEKSPSNIGQFLRELLDRAMHDGGGLGIVAGQHLIQRLLADLLRGLVAERVLAGLAQRLAPAIENLAESTLRGAV